MGNSKRILFCATVDYHFKAFHLPYMRWFQQQGWEVHIAANGNLKLPYCDKKYKLPIERTPLKLDNFKAYMELKKIIDQNGYDIIHAHTPVGGILARIAAKEARKGGTKVIYTAHGFHFCKGVPIINWLVYYPVERWLARYTDCLITINAEDYKLSSGHRFKAGRIEHVHGVGIDTRRYKPVNEDEKNALREKYGYGRSDFLIFYAAELNKNKNQGMLIRVVSGVREKVPGLRLLLIGDGGMTARYKLLAREYCVDDIVDFLGFREDVDDMAKMSDAAVASSLREGLPVNIMEAMACGKPVIATENRGHRELVDNGLNGWLVPKRDEAVMSEYIVSLAASDKLIKAMGDYARSHVIYPYGIDNVMEEMLRVYTQIV